MKSTRYLKEIRLMISCHSHFKPYAFGNADARQSRVWNDNDRFYNRKCIGFSYVFHKLSCKCYIIKT